MKFLVDAQLPQTLALALQKMGHDAIHTTDLPKGNALKDEELNEISMREKRVVITKDNDFVNSFYVHNKPYKLLLVTTGNIRNQQLYSLFTQHFDAILDHLEDHSFLELGSDKLVLHT